MSFVTNLRTPGFDGDIPKEGADAVVEQFVDPKHMTGLGNTAAEGLGLEHPGR